MSTLPIGTREALPDSPRDGRRVPAVRWRIGERLVEGLLFLAAASSVLITLGIVGILIKETIGFFTIREAGVRLPTLWEFVSEKEWTPLFSDARFGIRPLVCGTLITTLVALVVAVPVGTIVALWLSEYAPRRLRETVKPILELLSAVPTVVYGYFALLVVTPAFQWIAARFFHYDLAGFNMLGAGVVMGIMIIPYVASLSEDSMRAVPNVLREGAYAMGATKFQTGWKVVFPASLSGVTAAYILAISRALGETMVVAIAAGNQPTLTLDPRQPAATITAFIVQVSLGDLPHDSVGYRSIFAAGLTLMLMTLLFNVAGYWLRRRYREAY